MIVSPEGRALIAAFEGLSLTAYRCPAGVLTVGYGHTEGVQAGQRITQAEADALLASDLQGFSAYVESFAAPCSQHELDALTSLCFNIGKAGFAGSTVLRLHKAGDRQGAARAFSMWCKATVGGQLVTLPGLLSRRQREAAHYLTPDFAPLKAMPQAVEAPASVMASKSVMAGGVTVAAGAAGAADQINKALPLLDTATTAAYSVKSIMALGFAAVAIVGVCAAAYVLWRYIQKLKAGQAVST